MNFLALYTSIILRGNCYSKGYNSIFKLWQKSRDELQNQNIIQSPVRTPYAHIINRSIAHTIVPTNVSAIDRPYERLHVCTSTRLHACTWLCTKLCTKLYRSFAWSSTKALQKLCKSSTNTQHWYTRKVLQSPVRMPVWTPIQSIDQLPIQSSL